LSVPNVFEPQFDNTETRPGFSFRDAWIAVQAGCEHLGASLYELPPGETVCPYHAHLANEEMLLVIAGTPSLRTHEGWRELAEGEVVAFPVGERGAHQVQNRSDRPAKVLMVSQMIGPEVTLYPDSDKVLARERPPGHPPDGTLRRVFREADEVDYWKGESPPVRGT
jgi:uncharacterized cupin superfamily protein